ncbi:MAG: CoA transferase [Paracoccaceae bacterium]|nr:CoA transferase [Paracoccaceae bacterium]
MSDPAGNGHSGHGTCRQAPLPLDGIRVLDFTQVMMGPCCTQMLGDYGADVIKIERARTGDLSRWSIGDDPDGGNNPVFASLNRNKRSITLNLKSDDDRAIVLKLAETADVVVNNFRPGVMDRMGFGYEALRRLNPRIIYAVGTGFGTGGPYVRKGGQDVLAQAMSGVMHRRAGPELPLSVYPTALADYSAGMHLVQGILLALLQRESTGVGQQICVSLYNSMLAMQMQEAAMWMMRGKELNWAAMPLSGVFETTDGAIVMVGAFKENPLRDICQALDLEDLSADPRYANLEQQTQHRIELQVIFRESFAGNSTAHWLERLDGVDILCAPVKSLEDALDDPQTAFNRMIVDLDSTAGGPVRLVASPIDMSAAPFAVHKPPPNLGQHNDEVLAEVRRSGNGNSP